MSLLLETILFVPQTKTMPLLHYHRRRMMLSQLQIWNIFNVFDLENQILEAYQKIENPQLNLADKIKCRVLYNMNIQAIEFYPYQMQTLENLQIIENNQIDYGLKYSDRTALNLIKSSSMASDVLITKNGLITDISYANVAFSDGNEWFTPRLPLLKGTKRQALIDAEKLVQKDIQVVDLQYFSQILIFNAMMEKKYQFSLIQNGNHIYLQLN